MKGIDLMSLRKRCDKQPKFNTDGSVNPLYCAAVESKDDELKIYFAGLPFDAQDLVFRLVESSSIFINNRRGKWAVRIRPILRDVLLKRGQQQ